MSWLGWWTLIFPDKLMSEEFHMNRKAFILVKLFSNPSSLPFNDYWFSNAIVEAINTEMRKGKRNYSREIAPITSLR